MYLSDVLSFAHPVLFMLSCPLPCSRFLQFARVIEVDKTLRICTRDKVLYVVVKCTRNAVLGTFSVIDSSYLS